MQTSTEQKLRDVITRMRNEGPRYKSHDLGYVDSVSANNVDEWADEIEAAIADSTRECGGCGCSKWACEGWGLTGRVCCPDCDHGKDLG